MAKISDKILNSKTIFWFLLALGAALRIGSIDGALTHDELSAICRLNFDNFHDLIALGVLGDGHPAGVQVFMWLWSMVFGTSALAIRFPFFLMGIASIGLVYVIGRRWYGEWPALLPTAVMAVSQYTVFFSILARPYCAGVFLMLCLLYFWTRILINKEYKWYWLALFAVFAALCAYTHYYCMLSAFLLGVAGLLFVERQHLWHYLLACFCAMLLFLPHWSITSYMLFEVKGVGSWLGKPTPAFIYDYGCYLSHHSLLVAIVAVLGYMLVFSRKDARQNLKLMLVSLAIWVLPLLIGYLYSVLVNPLLQFSSLIFVFPLLLLALAGGVNREEHHGRQMGVILVYTMVMVLSLIFTRQHFQMVKNEWIEEAAKMERDAIDRYGAENVLCMLDVALDKVQYYDSSLYSLPQSMMKIYTTFDSLLSASSCDYMLCGGTQDPKIIDIVRHHYPYLLKYRNCVVSEVYLFSRKSDEEALAVEKATLFDCHKKLSAFEGEFYNILDTTLGDMTDSRFVCFNSQLLFQQADSVRGAMHLVTEVWVGKRRVEWREANTSELRWESGVSADSSKNVTTYEISLPIRIESYVKHRHQLKRTRLKVYLWNPENDTVTVPISCRVTLYPTNPLVYSALEEI